MLIEDDDLTRRSLAMLLDARGYAVAQAPSAEEALAYLRGHSLPALILLDLGLPGMSGWEFLEYRRRDPSLASVPVLIVSGAAGRTVEQESAPHIPYLQKPVGDDQLTAAVESLAVARPEVLVVEDESAVSRMLSVALPLYGFEARLAGSGREAVAVYRQHHKSVALVLMDVQMPDLDGPQTLVLLQAIDPHVRCCFMSGNTGAYEPDGLRQRGAACVIAKPFHLEDLANVLRLVTQGVHAGPLPAGGTCHM